MITLKQAQQECREFGCTAILDGSGLVDVLAIYDGETGWHLGNIRVVDGTVSESAIVAIVG